MTPLASQIETVIDRNPHCQEILRAFQPLLLERMRLAETISCAPLDDAESLARRLSEGVPVCEQRTIFSPDDPWEEVFLATTRALIEGFPLLQDDLLRLADALTAGGVALYECMQSAQGEQEIRRWAADRGLRGEAASLCLSSAAWPVRKRKRLSVVPFLDACDWGKGTCPFCGAFPAIAVVHDKVPQRWLHCPRCAHTWRFRRTSCPSCGREKPQGMTYFYVENREQETAFVCEQCNKYLVTLHHFSDWEGQDLDVWALGLTHLDILLQQKGFEPMSRCAWNGIR